MKITNTLLLVAVAGSLAACEKSAPDTAVPGEGDTPAMEEPSTDDVLDDAAGDDAEGDDAEGEEAEGEEAAEE